MEMPSLSITVLNGADRGKVFRNLRPPITVGREEGNSIQLNDERISRCHLKIQEDNRRLVLTDLDSTNGTKVNGQESHLRILRNGDLISVGRSLLLVGKQDEESSSEPGGNLHTGTVARDAPFEASAEEGDFDVGSFTLSRGDRTILAVPELPDNLSPSQAAQVSEVIESIHGNLRQLIEGTVVNDKEPEVRIEKDRWQSLLTLQSQLSQVLRRIGNPD
jgi:pSer/pThr/pTyr-binding forkhead associated (FHA) protein